MRVKKKGKKRKPRGRKKPPLASPSRNATDGAGSEKAFARNEAIFHKGQAARHIYKVETGCVRTFTRVGTDRRLVVAFYFPGDYFGLEMRKRHSVSAAAVAPAKILLISKGTLTSRAASDVAVANAMLTITQLELARARQHSMLLGISSASERVGQFLVDMNTRHRTSEFKLMMSRRDIADYLNLAVESVVRALTKLENESAISIRAARHIVIHDRERIAA